MAESRRDVLRTLSAAALVASCGPASTGGPTGSTRSSTGSTATSGDTGLVPPDCEVTPADIEGPYWVPDVPIRGDLDVHGEKGPRLQFGGVVRDAETCAPIEGAVVELWHADRSGDYDPLADGRYRGQVATDADGAYAFSTVVPGRYLNGATYRPAHLHLKVWVDGKERLTTQLYFDHDPYNEGDTWFEEDRIVADLDDGELLVGTFDLVV